MKWLFLIIAGFFEVMWAIELKYSKGFTNLIPSILTIIGLIASFYFLSISIKSLPLGSAYAIWTGIGTVGTVIFSIILFKETVNIMQIFCIILIVVGIIGLKMLSSN